MQTAEKLRREKWIKDKSQQIKVSKHAESVSFCGKNVCKNVEVIFYIL